MRLVRICWLDSVSNGGWKGATTIDDWLRDAPTHMQSVGYVIRDTEQWLVIASSRAGMGTDDEQYSCLTIIPRAAVATIEDIIE